MIDFSDWDKKNRPYLAPGHNAMSTFAAGLFVGAVIFLMPIGIWLMLDADSAQPKFTSDERMRIILLPCVTGLLISLAMVMLFCWLVTKSRRRASFLHPSCSVETPPVRAGRSTPLFFQ